SRRFADSPIRRFQLLGLPEAEGMGLRRRRSPRPGRRILHVEEEGRRAATGVLLALPLLRDLTLLLAVLAADGEGKRAQRVSGNLFAALVAVAVIALLEAGERIVHLVERLGLHLDERELELFLDVGLGAFDGIEHLVHLAAPGALFTHAAHLALHFG